MSRRLLALTLIVLLLPTAALAKEEHKRGGGLTFIQLPTLTATITRPDGTHGVATVEDGLDVPDLALHDRAASLQPRLQAAFNQFLTDYMASLTPGAPANADYLAGKLQALTDQIVGRPGATFLIGSILMN